MRVALVSADSRRTAAGGWLRSGSSWWRCEIPSRHLAANGHDAVHVPRVCAGGEGELVPVGWDGEPDPTGFDVVVLVRWMDSAAAGAIAAARATGQVVVNDCDDWFDAIHAGNHALRPGGRGRPAPDLGAYRAALAASSALTASTPYLASRLSPLGRPVGVVRNAIDLDRWPRLRPAGAPPVVGWVGATGWHPGDLETLAGVLGPYLRRHGFRFAHHGHADGAPGAAGLLGLDDDQVVRVRPMVAAERYPGLFEGLDLGLVPLRPSPFNEAKCLDEAVPVWTPQGPVPVGRVAPGDQVWSGRGWAEVEAVAREGRRAGHRVRTAAGREVILTPEHRMRTSGGWVNGGDLRPGHRLQAPGPPWEVAGDRGPADDVAVSVTPTPVCPVDVQVAGGVFVAGGLTSHNSAVKGMEYAASGVPFVAQATAEYRWFAEEVTAATAAEWEHQLERLADPEERAATAARLRARVEQLDAAVRWRDWEAVLTDVVA